MVGQQWNQLVFEIRTGGTQPPTQVRVNKPFERKTKVWIAVVCDGLHLSTYLDGEKKIEVSTEEFDNSSWTPASPLVLGCGTNGKFPWNGTIYEMAVIDRAATHDEMRDPFMFLQTSSAVLHYTFNEGVGRVVADHGKMEPADLTVPEKFQPAVRPVLVSPQSYWLPAPMHWDVIGNIIGFIPLGILLAAVLAKRGVAPSIVIVITLFATCGFSTALELLQAYLPARWSSTTDVLTNTFGGGLGALLYSLGLIKKGVNIMRLSFRETEGSGKKVN